MGSLINCSCLIEISNENANDSDNKNKTVATNGIIVGTKSFGKEVQAWIDFVLADSLEYSGCSHKGRNG